MIETKLGKIQSVKFGYGGYDDAMIGISFTLGGEGWGCGDFWGWWTTSISSGTKWTQDDRIKYLGEVTWRIKQLLVDARVETIDQLKNVPVEITFDANVLKSWRILKEVR